VTGREHGQDPERERVVRNRRGDIDVERSSLDVVIAAEAFGGRPRCEECGGAARFLDPSGHRWNCRLHPRHKRGDVSGG
jgi:hypothetical protein